MELLSGQSWTDMNAAEAYRYFSALAANRMHAKRQELVGQVWNEP